MTLRDGRHHRATCFKSEFTQNSCSFVIKRCLPRARAGWAGWRSQETRSPHAGRLEGWQPHGHTGGHGGPVHLGKRWKHLKCPQPTRVHPRGHIQLCPHYRRASVPGTWWVGLLQALKVLPAKTEVSGKEGILPQGCSVFSLSFQPAAPPANGSQTCQSLNHYANSFKEPFNIYTSVLLVDFFGAPCLTGQRRLAGSTVQWGHSQTRLSTHTRPNRCPETEL